MKKKSNPPEIFHFNLQRVLEEELRGEEADKSEKPEEAEEAYKTQISAEARAKVMQQNKEAVLQISREYPEQFSHRALKQDLNRLVDEIIAEQRGEPPSATKLWPKSPNSSWAPEEF